MRLQIKLIFSKRAEIKYLIHGEIFDFQISKNTNNKEQL